MDGPLREGIIFFNAGRYFEAHETWEDLWRITEGHARPFYQGLIHAAVGLHHLSRDNRTGAEAQLEKALYRLQQYPAAFDGIDNARLQEDLRQVLGDRQPPTLQIAQIEHT